MKPPKTHDQGNKWSNNAMKDIISNRKSLFKVALFVMVFFFGSNCQAQSWSNMTSWIQNQGWEFLATIAHPNGEIRSHRIVSIGSDEIILEISFTGPSGQRYTSKYGIEKGIYNGTAYFSRVRVYSDDFFNTSFIVWDHFPKFHGMLFSELLGNDGLGKKWYGSNYWDDLARGQKAAFALQLEFLTYWAN